jgi:hypothetical protein
VNSFLKINKNGIVRCSVRSEENNSITGANLLQTYNYTMYPTQRRIKRNLKNVLFNIQVDLGEICHTLGNDSMCDSKQKSSYEHGSDFERLPRYGKKKIRIILRARTAIA